MHIAIIGAGIAGLTCARSLQAQGNSVVVYEKSSGVSGRMSTRRNELGGFDHGAQYFTATTEAFKKQIAAWCKAGWVAPWDGKLVTLENGVTKPAGRSSEASKQRFVGIPGMNALGQKMAQGLDVRTEQLVKQVERYGDQWLLKVRAETAPIDASAGPFDAVIVAVPADQAIALLAPAPAFASQAEEARLAPCWTLLLGFQESLGLGYDGAWISGKRLAWIAQDASKPQRRPGEHWIGHASVEWSIEHLEEEPERAKEKLLKAFQEATGTHVQPIYAGVHRWRYSQANHPLDADYMWDADLCIGACGDWFSAGVEGNGRIETAYLSALALAETLR